MSTLRGLYLQGFSLQKLPSQGPKLCLLILVLALAPITQAVACYEASPARSDQSLYDVISSPALSQIQHELLSNFLKRLAKDRDGYSTGYFCKKNIGKVAVDNDDIRFRAQSLDDISYRFRVNFVGGNYGNDSERLDYTLTDKQLLLGPNERGNDIIIRSLTRSELVTYEKYRQATPNGANTIREVVRHYYFKNNLTVDNTYYVNGYLQSENRWVLH
ncbi:MAG: hypothetical protein WCY88_09600 [Spongiibacteraceae bacterium]